MSLDLGLFCKNGLIVTSANSLFANSTTVVINGTLTVNSTVTFNNTAAFVNSVSFANLITAAANVNIASGKLFIDAVNGRIGANSTSPTLTLFLNTTDGVALPAGNTAQRVGTRNGTIRYNSDVQDLEAFAAGSWGRLNVGANTPVVLYPGGANNTYQFNSQSNAFAATDTYYVGANTGFGNTNPNAKVQIQGTANVSSDVNIGGVLNVTGAGTFSNTMGITGAATLANTLTVTGAVTLSNTLNVTGLATFTSVNATANLTSLLINSNNVSTNNLTVLVGSNFSNTDVKNTKLRSYKEFMNVNNAVTTGALSVDLSDSNIFKYTLTGNPTLSFTNPPAAGNTSIAFEMWLVQDATGSRTVTWPASVRWSYGVAPTLSTIATKADVLSFQSVDGGTTYVGAVAMANVAST